MTYEEAMIVVGNITIIGDDCYSIAEYQEAKTKAIEALELQIPMKPIDNEKYQRFDCPRCHDVVIHYYIGKPRRCICGQALDWSGIE